MGCQAAALQRTRGSKLLCLLTGRMYAPRRASISHSSVSKSLWLECKVITRRLLVLAGERSPEENKPQLHHALWSTTTNIRGQKAEPQAASPGARPFVWLQTNPQTSQYFRSTGKGLLYYCSVIGIFRISCKFWSFLFSFRNSTRFCCCYQLFNSFYNKIFVIRNCALICVRLMDSIKALSGEAEWMGLQKWCHQGNWYLNSQSADLATKTCKYNSCFISLPWQNSPEKH